MRATIDTPSAPAAPVLERRPMSERWEDQEPLSGLSHRDFYRWRTNTMAWTQQATAQNLGISERQLRYYEDGQREDGTPVAIPLKIGLAMVAMTLWRMYPHRYNRALQTVATGHDPGDPER